MVKQMDKGRVFAGSQRDQRKKSSIRKRKFRRQFFIEVLEKRELLTTSPMSMINSSFGSSTDPTK